MQTRTRAVRLTHCMLALAVLIGGALARPATAAIVRQPYLQMVTPDSIIIMWRTDLASPTDSRVQYGTVQGVLNQEATAVAVTPPSNANVRDHIVTITGLSAATKYFYNVGTTSGGEEAGGTADHYFKTAPAVGSILPFTVWFVGDGGNNSAQQAAVRDAMLVENGGVSPDLLVQLGDIAYDNGTDSEFTNNHFAPYANILRNTVCYPTLGNHEGVNTVSGACWPLPCAPGPTTGPYYEAHVLPTMGEAGGEPSGTEAYYSFDFGNVHFIVLNSQQVDRNSSGPMAQWLQADLASTTQDWVIATFHHPVYSKGTHDSDSFSDSGGRMVEMRELIVPILEAGGVDLVLGGHSHTYERSYLINGVYGYGSSPNFATPSFAVLEANGHILDGGDGDPAGDGAYEKSAGMMANEGTVYIVAGHGGRSVGGSGLHPVMYFTEAAFGSCLMEVESNRIFFRNVRMDGAITDEFSLFKGTCEDFEDGFTLGQTIGAHADWFDGGAGPVVTAGIGVDGSVGLTDAANIFTWTAHPFNWADKDFAGIDIEIDLQTDPNGVLDDDRLGWMIVDDSVSSDFIFGIQVDPSGDATDGQPAGSSRLEGYWDAVIGVTEDRRPGIDSVVGNLTPNTFYRLRGEFTKLTDTSAMIEASLTELDASGVPVAGPPVLSGTIADTSVLGADAPDVDYFTGPMWPGFKNFNIVDGAADNICVDVRRLSTPLTRVSFQQGVDGYVSTVDTFLDSQNPNASNAAASTLIVDLNPVRHILLRFDDIFGSAPGMIPPTASIVSASLTINVTNESVGVGASLHRMLQPWNDTDTWNIWNAGISANDVEAVSKADAAGSSGVGPFTLDVTSSLLDWASDPGSNHGWAWLPPGTDNSWQFDSAEGGTPPLLEVVYQLICTNSVECDDGNPCTTDLCAAGACSNTPVTCLPGEVCDQSTGSCVQVETITFQEGLEMYVGTLDTTFQENAPGNVNGALQEWEWDDDDPNGGGIQRNLGLLRFDDIFGTGSGQIPPGSEVFSATLSYTAFDPGVTGSLREMLVDWDESDSLTSACGAACEEGIDYAAAAIASAPGVVGTQTLDVTASLQAWATNPAAYRGWMVIPTTGANGGVQVRSSEYLADPSLRPSLTVVFRSACEVASDCDDGNPCTDEVCGSNGLCSYDDNTDACDDADPCTESDMCAGGVCVGNPKDCGMQICRPADGMCVDCVTDDDCDDANVCNGDEICNASGECDPGMTLDCDDSVACTDDSCHPVDGCQHADNCPSGQQCNLGTGECVAAPLLIAYNDMNPVPGDANAANVTTHTYLAVNGVLKDFNSGVDSTITMTGTTIGGYDANFPGNGGQANAGTDAGDIFGPAGSVIVDLSNTIELDAADWDNIMTFSNLNPARVYTITVTANRNNPDYNGARFTRVTIEGADTFTNTSSPGVVVNSPSSVSFSTGYNTVNGYVARWTNVTAADGSVSVKSEWDNTLGSGASNTKGYAMGAFRLEESSTLCDLPSDCDDGLFCNGVEDCVDGVCVSGASPCTDPDLPICDDDLDACLVDCEGTLLVEDFNGFSAGAEPAGWFDTAAMNSLVQDDSLFEVFDVNGDLAFGTASTLTNIHSHYTAGGASGWSGYEFTGRMRMTATDSGVGVTFFSQFPDQVAYYRLRRFGTNSFHVSPFGTSISGGVTDTLVIPVVNEWYRFRVQVEDTGSQTEIRARVWLDNTAEPGVWQVDCFDSSVTRLTSGAVGAWSFNPGSKFWDDLEVTLLETVDGPCNDGDPCTADDFCLDGVCAGVFDDCDGDTICDADDNCPSVSNVGQADTDLDGFGDACDNPFDADHDGDVDLSDYEALAECLGGADVAPSATTYTVQECLDTFDTDADNDVDLQDYNEFAQAFTGATAPDCD